MAATLAGSAAPAVCTAENTVAPELGDLASAPLRACSETGVRPPG
ncbi:hypothetical protein [Streptomyces sp. S.PB5]|nr:hypothetical protein [Streptomyces sp. S.PB5]MDN3023403.1 hypothetical protein [Streptomyces sp. S.PB5]